jgi:hypothetical protein
MSSYRSRDYAEVGLIAGLEVHQQLLTAIKMSCRCPAGRYTETHDGFVLRHMRPTLSELGEYDGTALMEFKTKKNIIYLLHKENVCTYEINFGDRRHNLEIRPSCCPAEPGQGRRFYDCSDPPVSASRRCTKSSPLSGQSVLAAKSRIMLPDNPAYFRKFRG